MAQPDTPQFHECATVIKLVYSKIAEPIPMLQSDVATAERIASLTLDRANKRNALSLELMEQLTCALEDIGRRTDVSVVILGAHGSVFSSGHDLGELVDRSPREYQ